MTFSKADRAATERLSAAVERLRDSMDALTDVISARTKQLKAGSPGEMKSLRRLTKLVGVKPKIQKAKTKTPILEADR